MLRGTKKKTAKRKSTKKVAKRVTKKVAKRKTTRKNPDDTSVGRFQPYYNGKLTWDKLEKLRDTARKIDKLYTQRKYDDAESEELKFIKKYGKLARLLIEEAQMRDSPYA